MMIDCNRQFALSGYEGRTEAQILVDKQQALTKDLQDSLGDSNARPGIIVELRKTSDDLIKGQLTEQTAKLQAEQRLWTEEFSEKKRQRDRDLYRVHEENYTYNASATKLILADKKLAAYTSSGQGNSGELSTSQFEEVNEDIRQARKIGIEETDAARRRKQEERREKQREQLTKIKSLPVFPEPLCDVSAKSLQSEKKKKFNLEA